MGAEVPVANFNAPPLAAQMPVVATPQPRYDPAPAAKDRAARPTPAREWIPLAQARPWRWIVIHHSATRNGSVTAFDRMHKQKGWDECGYHFVIGNGDGAGDGQIQVGPRWPKQKWGAHAKTADNKYNEFGIGICLVGNFDESRPTEKQLASLARLTAYLQQSYGISGGNILGHSATGKQTACPGRNMNIATVRKMADRMAGLNELPSTDHITASAVELLQPIR
ncbi:MAG TPA: peptidoglycan recognition family protein [Tepidisphaeraceae bacterium]|nr:peptidoglycan recognition family protein [Tepidisphaeraceae bacterium]